MEKKQAEVRPVAKAVEEELPVVHAIAVLKAPKATGWITLGFAIQGDRVIETEILQGPDSKALALERGKLAFVNRFYLDRGWNAK